MPDDESLPLDLDELLAAEYDYIAQTANQANEDRARVSSFYLIAVGSLLAAMFGTQLFDPGFYSINVNLMFSGLFMLLTLLGTSTIMQLARLRAAWYELCAGDEFSSKTSWRVKMKASPTHFAGQPIRCLQDIKQIVFHIIKPPKLR